MSDMIFGITGGICEDLDDLEFIEELFGEESKER